jgi:hypothetical protein
MSEGEGRERVHRRDRDEQTDTDERAGRAPGEASYNDPGDPLSRARSEAADDNLGRTGDIPGNTGTMEEWQREKQMAGQGADDPGLPQGRRPGGGRESGTAGGGHNRPLERDEFPDPGDETQG